jgi:membrane complex biogenesis BtpA family protein
MKLNIFNNPKPIIGMVHLPSLPGTKLNKLSLSNIVKNAVQDSIALENGGVDGLIIENYNDIPFSKSSVEPHIVSALTLIVNSVKQEVSIPYGINVLRNDWRAAIGIASITGSKFVRINVFSGAMITDQGVIEGDPKGCIEYRDRIAPKLKIFADVWVKHGIPLRLKERLSVAQAAKDTVYRGLADAIILTGEGTGEPVDLTELKTVRKAVSDRLLFIGSGVNNKNIVNYLDLADGFIIGTYFKRGGRIGNRVDIKRVTNLVDLVISSKV